MQWACNWSTGAQSEPQTQTFDPCHDGARNAARLADRIAPDLRIQTMHHRVGQRCRRWQSMGWILLPAINCNRAHIGLSEGAMGLAEY